MCFPSSFPIAWEVIPECQVACRPLSMSRKAKEPVCSSVWPALIYPFKCCLPRNGNGCPPVTSLDWGGISLTLSFASGTLRVRDQETFRAAGSFFHPQWSFDLLPKSMFPHSLGEIKCQGGSSWHPLASERFLVPGGRAWPGRCGQGAVEASWHNSMLRVRRG